MAYEIQDRDGKLISSHNETEAQEFLYGYGLVLPAVEEALEGLEAGEELQLVLAAEDAYGPYRDDLITRVERSHFANEYSIAVGMRFSTTGPDGQDMLVEVVELDDKYVVLDGNHPLAGMDLIFSIRVLEVRAAEPEELAMAKGLRDRKSLH